MYARGNSVSDAELEALGLAREDIEEPEQEIRVYPENWPALQLFSYLATQWRIGMGGATGLDYNVMFHKLDRMNLEPDEYEQREQDIRIMEREALKAMAGNAKSG